MKQSYTSDKKFNHEDMRADLLDGDLVIYAPYLEVEQEDDKENTTIAIKHSPELENDKDNDSDKILDYLYDNDGVAYLSDKSSPEKIDATFAMSKSSFKRAIGRLYKNNDIKIYDNRIELVKRI